MFYISDHKHLGITFSEEAKWNKHVENLIKSVSKHICVLRKLKYKLNRQNLEKLYLFTFDQYLSMHVRSGTTVVSLFVQIGEVTVGGS